MTDLRLGIACPLPPTPCGPADYVAGLLAEFASRAHITCFVADPAEVDPAITERYDVRAMAEIASSELDLPVYHLANNLWHREVVDAAREGPPGLAVVHDASLHHLVSAVTLDQGNRSDYTRLLTEAHGDLGRTIASLRRPGDGLDTELFLFDMLGPVLMRQLGALVHSTYARSLVMARAPGLPVWVVPHYAIGHAVEASRAELGLPEDRFLIGHLGYVTIPKRPELLIDALERLVQAGYPAHLVFAGADHWGLDALLERRGLKQHVTITGLLAEGSLDAYASVLDVVVSLRWPHVGETSGTLFRALRAGTPSVVHNVGGWADLPDDAVIKLHRADGEGEELADRIRELIEDDELRRQKSRGAKLYAQSVAAGPMAQAQLEVMGQVAQLGRVTPQRLVHERRVAADAYLRDPHPESAVLRLLPPAFPGASLLVIGACLSEPLPSVWGYDVYTCKPPDGNGDESIDLQRTPLPYETGEFDVVLVTGVLERLDLDPLRFLVEVNRVLKPAGLLVLGLHTKSVRATGRVLSAAIDSPNAVRAALESAGLSVQRLELSDGIAVTARKVSLPSERYPRKIYG